MPDIPEATEFEWVRVEAELLAKGRRTPMSDELPSTPSPVERHRKAIPPRVWGPVVLLILAVVATAAVYGYHEHRVVKQLNAEKTEMMASLDATHSLITALTSRVNELSAQPTSGKPAASQLAGHRRQAASHRRTEDPRWKEIRTELAAQQKQIEANRQDLSNSRTELQGSIARTHDELVILEKRGERKYFEFDLDKNGQFGRQGPVGLRLRKADTKHQYADLEMLVDDVKLSKKHVNLDEPAFFYSGESRQPAELVINSITKNHIHGYVAEAKYKSSDLETMANSSGSNEISTSGTAAVQAPQPRQRLEPPKN